ncbi:MAG: hypothetical protein OEY67_00865 [Gammaproteobacteria bacterium]|nr:hypothetical protein [Gammaproteobacteria bacterium]
MTAPAITRLQDCIERYQATLPGLAELGKPLPNLSSGADADTLNTLIQLYEQVYPLLEQALWSDAAEFHSLLACYQSLFREQEVLIQQRLTTTGAADDRYHFILSIPVADRPSHLRTCLDSIYQVCKQFNYGGNRSGTWQKITIIVAEDSREPDNIRQHKDLIEEYRRKGLQVLHFDQAEQYELLQAIPKHQREQLGNILTTQPRERFYLKGQAANRNLSYLRFLQLTQDKNKTLYYLVDSDQSFCVNRQTEIGDEAVVALNYFYYFDKLFRSTDTLVLTGKMVGDPPVSPSVMAGNFLDDVTAFFTELAQQSADRACQFHDLPKQTPGDAAYHDMAKLFGFDNKPATFPYRCRLKDKHDHIACLTDVAGRLNAFFFGEHLTRKTRFTYGQGFTEITPARTIYPGNYIVNYEGLKYIIPFGHLRLRMSGPTAGRLIAAEIKGRFASVNLPHLHRRTTETGLTADFRPGVKLGETGEQRHIDLSNEFERQFFGDLMLFSTEALVQQADVTRPFKKDQVVAVINKKERELLELYQQKHKAIREKHRQLQHLVFHAGHWWTTVPALTDALQQVQAFLNNIDHNFGEQSQAWQQISSTEHRAQRKQQITDALLHYRAERDAWDSLFI